MPFHTCMALTELHGLWAAHLCSQATLVQGEHPFTKMLGDQMCLRQTVRSLAHSMAALLSATTAYKGGVIMEE